MLDGTWQAMMAEDIAIVREFVAYMAYLLAMPSYNMCFETSHVAVCQFQECGYNRYCILAPYTRSLTIDVASRVAII